MRKGLLDSSMTTVWRTAKVPTELALSAGNAACERRHRAARPEDREGRTPCDRCYDRDTHRESAACALAWRRGTGDRLSPRGGRARPDLASDIPRWQSIRRTRS